MSMEKEIELLASNEDKEYSEENYSDTSYEDSFECELPEVSKGGATPAKDPKVEDDAKSHDPSVISNETEAKKRARGDRLTSNQLALLHLRNLYSPEIIEIIKSSEKSILNLFDFISGDILNIPIRPNAEDELVGSKVLKGAYLLNIMKDNFAISLRKESVSRFLAKAFEYLLNFDLNYGICAKIVHIMNQLKFRAFDLSYVAAMMKVTEGRKVFIIKAFEKNLYQTSNTRISQDLKDYVIKGILKLMSKINIVFTEDFKELYKYTDDFNMSYLDDGGPAFSYNFIPVKYLNQDDFSIIMNEVMFFRTTDIKMKSMITTSFLVRAVKNKYFQCTSEILQRIFYDASNLLHEIVKENELNGDMYIADMAYILAHIPFSKANTPAQAEEALNLLKGFFESIVDVFHPMSPRIFPNYYFKKLVSNFVGTYCKQAKKYCSLSKYKIDVQKITSTINPLLRRMVNFAVIGVYWEGLDDSLIDLCCLDVDYFLDDILRKIQMSYNQDELRKLDILRSIRNLSPFMRTPKTVPHLQWIVPKLTAQLELSDSETLSLVSRALVSIFQNFIKIEESNIDHLKPLKPMIEDATCKFIEFYFRQGQTFSLENSFISVVVSVSEKCAQLFKDKLFQACDHDFFSLKPATTENFVAAIHQLYPKEVEAKIETWIMKNVLKKREKPLPIGKLVLIIDDAPLAKILKLNKIQSMEYELQECNEKTAVSYLHALNGLAKNSWQLSENMYKLCLTIYALGTESSSPVASRISVRGFSKFFEDYCFTVQGCSSTARLLKAMENPVKQQLPAEFKWVIPERANPERTTQMIESIFFETLTNCERLMQEIYTKGPIQATSELYVEQFFGSNLHKPIIEDRHGKAENELTFSPQKKISRTTGEKADVEMGVVKDQKDIKEAKSAEDRAHAEAIKKDQKDTVSESKSKIEDKDDPEKEDDDKGSKIGQLAFNLKMLADCLSTHYFQLLQMRSNRLRGILEVFKKRLTYFLAQTDTYPRMKAAYLTLFHINNQLAANISFGNKETNKLWNLPKSILLNIKMANFNFQSELASSILVDYLPINNFCHYDKWMSIDNIQLDMNVFKDYPMDEFKQNPDTFFWVFSRELCDYLFNKVITTFFRQIILFMQVYESKSMFEDIKELINGSWLSCSSVDLVQFLLWTLINITTIDHNYPEKFNKTALYIEVCIEICMKGCMIKDEETVFNILQIGRQLITKGTYALTFPIYFNLIKMLLGWCYLPPNCKIDHMTKLLDAMNARSDTETSIIDLLEVSTRFLLFFRSWNAEFRSKLVQYVLNHINSKDINKRIIYMGINAFINRILRRTDYVFEEVMVKQDKFVNQNGYADMYMLKEAFRVIRKNIGYTDQETSIFNKDQLEELAKINENCIPTVILPQYLSLPFRALTFKPSEESTTAYFKSNYMSEDDLKRYQDAIIDYLGQLVSEYSEEFEESTLNVKYDFAELVIDTKQKFKFDKELQIFTTLKIFCMFLGFDATKKVFDLINIEHQKKKESQADYNKVLLGLYCALLGAAGFYSEEEFMRVLEMGKPILKPFFNSFNAKFLESFIVHLNKSLRGNLSYKRLKLFFNMIKDMMFEDTKANYVYYINILIFQVTISQVIVPDEWLEAFKRVVEIKCDNDLIFAAAMARIFRSIYSVRMLISFNELYIKNSKRVFTEDTLSYHLYDREVIDFDDLLIEFLRDIRGAKTWVKIGGIIPLISIIFDKKITSHNLSMVKKLFQILFTMDATKDFSDESVIPLYRRLIQDLRFNTVVQRNIKEQILSMLSTSWQVATTYEAYKGILMIYRLGFSSRMTEIIHKFLMMITKTTKLGLQDDIFIFMRDDILRKLSDNDLFNYAKRLIAEYPTIVEKIKKLPSKQSHEYAQLNVELESYCEILLAIIASRRWQMNARIEECLKHVLICRKYSDQAKATFKNFVTEFWSKREIHLDINDYKLDPAIREEFGEQVSGNYA